MIIKTVTTEDYRFPYKCITFHLPWSPSSTPSQRGTFRPWEGAHTEWFLPCACMLSHFGCVQLFVTPLTIACQAPLSMGFSGKNTGVGCHALLQGIFLTQGWNLGLPNCRQVLYHLSHTPTPKDSPSFSSLAQFISLESSLLSVCAIFFSSLIEFPAVTSPVPSYEQVMMTSSHSQLSLPQVFAIAAYSKGFACSAGPGRVLLFEKMEDKEFYRESREIRVRRGGSSNAGVQLATILQEQSTDAMFDQGRGLSAEHKGTRAICPEGSFRMDWTELWYRNREIRI